MPKVPFTPKSADSIRAGDRILAHGSWMLVAKTRHVNRHPVQLYEIYLEGLEPCLRVPAGWQIKVLDIESEA